MPTVEVTMAAQAANRYPTVPFDVPAGCDSVEVELLGAQHSGAVVDMGCEGPDGWRGWSGGARTWFVIRRNDATPGYLPGLAAGRWRVVLGLHSVGCEPATVRIKITMPAQRAIDHGPDPSSVLRQLRGSDRRIPAEPGLTWFAGDMHAHSLHSDGALSLRELANEAVTSGLDFLCVTDHNTVSHHAYLGQLSTEHGVLLMPGQEVTTHQGHANVFGRTGFIDFRQSPTEWVRVARDRGGVLSINHPVCDDCSWLHPSTPPVDAVELYHGSWYAEPSATSILAWDVGREPTTIIGGGDFHSPVSPLRPGCPTTWIAATECSEAALLDGLRAGRTFVTAGVITEPSGVVRPDLKGTPALVRRHGVLLVLAAEGLVLVNGRGDRRVITDGESEVVADVALGPWRLEDAQRRVLALCR